MTFSFQRLPFCRYQITLDFFPNLLIFGKQMSSVKIPAYRRFSFVRGQRGTAPTVPFPYL
ncbi:Uncharacterized protein dnm_004240 [Desulfonema magnum]|uniref:Uncharacterized protein n=1 Tax=Desulfonema magnum TaxID=45655 RepID=A0A975BFM5_9BACT|nr:Uncharacterized protein dnm_004240 [Desulfonema magnum]